MTFLVTKMCRLHLPPSQRVRNRWWPEPFSSDIRSPNWGGGREGRNGLQCCESLWIWASVPNTFGKCFVENRLCDKNASGIFGEGEGIVADEAGDGWHSCDFTDLFARPLWAAKMG